MVIGCVWETNVRVLINTIRSYDEYVFNPSDGLSKGMNHMMHPMDL